MEPTFRASMNWLHTWAGVVLGGVLFAIFWMGSLSVFDHEIDRWMAPLTRLAAMEAPPSLDALRPSLDAAIAPESRSWTASLPTNRQPFVRVGYARGGEWITRLHDPASGAALPDPGTLAGTQFLYPFHYSLHIRLAGFGIWIVGLAGMAMLALCVSGVVIHRKIFADFFTFRPRRKSRRVLLDLHNTAGVLGLPFHIAITLSGLVIFGATYFPSGWQAGYKDIQSYYADAFGSYDRPASGRPGRQMASLDAMAAGAQRMWDGDPPRYVQLVHPGDAAAYVIFDRSSGGRVAALTDAVWFDAATGRLLYRNGPPKPAMTAQRFIAGMHLVQFRHWTLRWLYFAMGFAGCVLIATGYLFWLDSRRVKHAQLGLPGVRIVDGLAVGSVTGIVLATLAFFVANRLLPLGISFAGVERAALEIWAFYLLWLIAFAHAWARPRRAWVEQCRAIALFAITAVLLNWITTGDHPIRSLTHRHLWPIAGMDLLLIAGAAVAALAAHRLTRRSAVPRAKRVRDVPVAQAAE